MYQTTLAPTATIPEIWDTIVRNLGGKRIKFLDMACSQYNNFTDISNFKKDTFSDAILLKNSTEIIFCNYTMRNKTTLWKCSLESIDKICAFYDRNEQYILLHSLDDGLFWRLSITTE